MNCLIMKLTTLDKLFNINYGQQEYETKENLGQSINTEYIGLANTPNMALKLTPKRPRRAA